MNTRLRRFYETGRQVNADPLVVVFEDFLQDQEIEQLLNAARPQLQQALVSSSDSGVESPGRFGSNCWISHRHNQIIHELSQRVAEVVGIPLEHAESLQVVHYKVGEQYAPHFDAWDAGTERGQRCMAKGGQRLLTCLLYLNEPEQGGGTCFPQFEMEVRAQRGRMLLFHNCHEGSAVRHPGSLHGGMPVSKGEKWACNLWFREQPYQLSAEPPQAPDSSAPLPSYGRII